jgi:hypothetical protein
MNDYPEVEAYLDNASGDLIATEIQRDNVDYDRLQGPAGSCDGAAVGLLGLVFDLVDGATSYENKNEDNINPINTAAEFCTQQQGGFLVKVVDVSETGQAHDGIADEAELGHE